MFAFNLAENIIFYNALGIFVIILILDGSWCAELGTGPFAFDSEGAGIFTEALFEFIGAGRGVAIAAFTGGGAAAVFGIDGLLINLIAIFFKSFNNKECDLKHKKGPLITSGPLLQSCLNLEINSLADNLINIFGDIFFGKNTLHGTFHQVLTFVVHLGIFAECVGES